MEDEDLIMDSALIYISTNLPHGLTPFLTENLMDLVRIMMIYLIMNLAIYSFKTDLQIKQPKLKISNTILFLIKNLKEMETS